MAILVEENSYTFVGFRKRSISVVSLNSDFSTYLAHLRWSQPAVLMQIKENIAHQKEQNSVESLNFPSARGSTGITAELNRYILRCICIYSN